jgi:predicted CopG family antitoxin
MTTQIQISDELWEYLRLKKKRGETFDEVLKKELNISKNKKI